MLSWPLTGPRAERVVNRGRTHAATPQHQSYRQVDQEAQRIVLGGISGGPHMALKRVSRIGDNMLHDTGIAPLLRLPSKWGARREDRASRRRQKCPPPRRHAGALAQHSPRLHDRAIGGPRARTPTHTCKSSMARAPPKVPLGHAPGSTLTSTCCGPCVCHRGPESETIRRRPRPTPPPARVAAGSSTGDCRR